MPTSLTLGPSVSVSRGGATLSWTIPSGGNIAAASGFVAGSVAPYLRFQINPSGGGGLVSLPSQINLAGNTWTITDPTNSEFILGDSVGIGDISGIINHATNEGAQCHTPNTPTFTMASSGLSLATLNAGGYYLYVGLSCPSAGSLSATAAGTKIINGGTPVPWTSSTGHPSGGTGFSIFQANGDTSCVIQGTWTINATGFPSYLSSVNVTITPEALSDVGGATANGWTQLLTNSYGGSASSVAPATTTLNTPATVVNIPLVSGSGSTTFDHFSSFTGAIGIVGGTWQTNFDYTAAVPSVVANAITISQMTATIPDGTFRGKTGGPTFGGTIGVNGGSTMAAFSSGCDEMTTAYLSDVLDFYAQFTDPATGAPANPTGTPTYRIYNQLNGTVLATGTLAALDSGNTVGLYGASVTLSGSYTVGHCYVVVVLATVATVSQEGIVERFIVRDTVTNSVWNTLDFGDATGRATNIGGQISQIWRYLFNRQLVDKNAQTQTLFRDDNATPLVTGSIVANSQTTSKGKMS